MLGSFVSKLFFISVLALVEKLHAQGDASSACGNVLQQGVYNIFSSSASSATYAEFQSAMCSLNSSTSFSEYYNSAHSETARGTYNSFSTAVKASYGLFGGSFSTEGQHSDSEMSKEQFETFQKLSSSYQSQYCGSNSGKSGSAQYFNQYMQTINPQVYSAYQSCISLYSTGVRFTSQNGWGANSVFVNLMFVTTSFGSKALLSGIEIVPEGAATCKLYGDKGPTQKFYASLIPDETYSVACKSNNNATVDVVTVAVTTSHGTYITYLYNKPPNPLLEQLQSQVTQLQAELQFYATQLQNQITRVNATAEKAANGPAGHPMKQTVYQSGSGVFTVSTNPSPLYFRVKAVGGGGGGCGGFSVTSSFGGCGGNGAHTVFGDNILFADGGSGPPAGGGSSPSPGGDASCAQINGLSCFHGSGRNGILNQYLSPGTANSGHPGVIPLSEESGVLVEMGADIIQLVMVDS
jgi:hypothetical protein